MDVIAEKLEKSRVKLTIEVPDEKFEESMQKAYKIVVKKVNVPGFRKGKAPRRIVEKMFGRGILMEEAVQDAVPKAYIEALAQVKDEYTAVSNPDYEMVEMEEGKPFTFKATFDVKPEVILGEYKGIELERLSSEVKTEDVDAEIEKMQQRYAKLVVIEDGEATEGDSVSIDFLGKVDGEPFEGGTGENYALELGSNTFIPGFESQVIGVKVGETKDVLVTFPEEYQAENLAGKDAVFTVTVREIKRKEYSSLDDEFAKDVSEFETLQELREDVENKLKEAAEKKAEQSLRQSALQKVAKSTQVEIPQSLIENRINAMVNDFEFSLSQQGFTLEKYLEITNTKLEDLRNNYRANAEVSVKADFTLDAIAKAENIEATQENVDAEIEKMAKNYKQDLDKIRETMEKEGHITNLKFGIMLDKALSFIIEQANIK
ncbi:MAG: trigger factor [Clostridia bacterium]|nr:trigger factor [Clostridia bacterium]MDD4047580.1 trigger factor [Clostridia bacterium]